MKSLKTIIVVLVMAAVFLVGGSIALAQSGAGAPATGNIAIRDGINPGEVVVSWDAVLGTTHYRIGYVNMETDYPLAKASVTGDWISAFIYVDENARNIQVSNGRAEYTVRRLEQDARHAFTVLTSSNFVDTGGAGSVSSEFSWPSNPRWTFHTVADRGGAPGPAPSFDFVIMYPNCDAVRAHYPGGATQSSPIYRPELDPDGDGVACEPISAIDIDRAALVTFYNATDGPNWTNNSNWLSNAPLNQWHGVTTDRGGRVTALNINSNQLRGELPAELGSLVKLQRLDLDDNQLSGGLPAELGSLTNLQQLHFWGNQLSGEIPSWLGTLTSLSSLTLAANQFSGSIPVELSELTNLTSLDLYLNQLSGEIPTELETLTNLTFLSFGRNQMTGEIPAELGNLTNLTFLSFDWNRLSGPIPPELGSLANLQKLYLSENQLTGQIPTDLSNLVNLHAIELGGNRLTGCIPAALRNVSHNDFARLGLPFCN